MSDYQDACSLQAGVLGKNPIVESLHFFMFPSLSVVWSKRGNMYTGMYRGR